MNDEVQNTEDSTLAPEVANSEFARFADLWDIDTNVDSMTEDDIDSFEKAKRPLIRGFSEGWLTCDDEGILTFELQYSKKADFSKVSLDPAKADVLSMDKYKDRQNMHKLKAYMATMAGRTVNKLADLDSRDEKRIRGPILLFLGS